MATADRVIWRDGEFVAWGDATVHILAQSLQRGTLAFDYLSVHETSGGPAILKLPEHVARLFETCRIMGLPIGHGKADLMRACIEAVRRNPGATSLKISALIASVEAELVPQDSHVAVFIAAYDNQADIIAHRPGEAPAPTALKLKIERRIRNRRKDIVPPQAKMAANYAGPAFAKWRARREGFDEILLLDESDAVAEGPTANLFAVLDGALVTPGDERVLLGITRASILELAEAMDVPCEKRALGVAELLAADEAFLCSTSRAVAPVAQIDETRIGDGQPGPLTVQLRDRFAAIVSGQDPEFAHWLTPCAPAG
ncbi:MAG: aminotransferase class IV [Gammaproteobacteria bacterium]|nr:aminotransferase class IV [Gammaproteobacteria bacterium]